MVRSVGLFLLVGYDVTGEGNIHIIIILCYAMSNPLLPVANIIVTRDAAMISI